MYRRSAFTNTRVENTQPHEYELPGGENDEYMHPYDYTQLSAPAAGSTNAANPSDNGSAQQPAGRRQQV